MGKKNNGNKNKGASTSNNGDHHGGEIDLQQVNKGKNKKNKQHDQKTHKQPSGTKGGASVDYYSQYFSDDMVRDIVADSPDINRTAALYSKPDCYPQ